MTAVIPKISKSRVLRTAEKVAKPGFRNTGQLILVEKNDPRRCIFADLINEKSPDGKWTMKLGGKLKGKSIKKGNNPHHGGHPGEQILLGEAGEALNVKWDGEYIKYDGDAGFYLEVPRA